ncbi:transketolase family protein [Plantactinospora solaniradicis]|uniref:Transketolase family protein n=1 Tax=Plantactinospora solaniradicis TaxID=1723736 RepID=A0ABW1KGM7_9ACTN
MTDTQAPPETGTGPDAGGQAPESQEKMVDVFADDKGHTVAKTNPVGVEIARLADLDDRVVALSADMSAVLADLRQRHPERYFEFGIAETNTISAAAGMAASGLRPYVLSMAPFGAIKCAEQLRTDVAYNHLPVRFVARLSGLAMGFFGTSHHAVEDIAIARTLTNLTVVAPADANATIGLLRSTVDHDGPVFYRISEGTSPVYPEPPTFSYGKWVQVRPGKDLTIIGYGIGVGLGLAAAEILAAEGIDAAVLDALYLKPFDSEALLAAARDTGKLLTVEEHNEIGGLGSIVAEALGRNRVPADLDTLALPDVDLEVGVPAALHAHYGLTPDGVAQRARALVGA